MPRRLRSAQSFALYYGPGGEDVLSRFDLAVVEPGHHGLESIKRLKVRSATALAYVSVLEVPRQAHTSPPANVLYFQDQPLAHTGFDNWVLDPRSPRTRDRLLTVAERLLGQGYDGLFLDTVSDVEDRRFSAEFMGELLTATAWMTAEVSRRFSSCVLVQNWGLHRLLSLTAPYLDGLCWEDFPYDEIGPVPAVHSGIRYLQGLQEQIGLRVLALNQQVQDAETARLARDAAERCNFIWYGSPSYMDLPPGWSR